MSVIMEALNNEFAMPFQPYDYQERVVKEAAGFDNVLLPLRVGAGKTPIATWLGLWHSMASDVERLLFLVPAPLVTQWSRWLEKITFLDGDALDVLAYQGTPAQRAKMTFAHDCIIMSHQIFVRDYHTRVSPDMSKDSHVFVTYDESQDGLRKAGNKIWRLFKHFTSNKRTVLLSGTPVSTPGDCYAVIKLLSPEIYKNKRAFEREHVDGKDFFGQVTAWKNLDILKQNLYSKAILVRPEELTELPGLIVEKVPYQLTPKHMALYQELVEEQLLYTDNGGVIDATETNRMFHTLQRFVTSPNRMDIKAVRAALFRALKTLYYEDDSKLIVYSNYRDTNAGVLEFFKGLGVKTVAAWGAYTGTQQQRSKDAFMDDEDTRVFVCNPLSVGVGTDGLQNVCFRAVYTELPLTPTKFEQSTGRIDRNGQTVPCIVKCLIAENTIQDSLYYALLTKNDLLQRITTQQMNVRDLFTHGFRA